MAIEAIEDQSPSPALDLTDILQRLGELEQEQRQLRWSSLLIAGLATIAVGLAVSTSLGQRFEPQGEMQPMGVNRRAIAAQAFVLTDPQGHTRAKLTFE